MKRLLLSTICAIALLATPALAQLPPPPNGKKTLSNVYTGKTYSPYAGRRFPSRPLWGDSHLHTALSMDAGAIGNTLGVREAYQFARGDEITSTTCNEQRSPEQPPR